MKPLFILVLSVPHLLLGAITLFALFDMPGVRAADGHTAIHEKVIEEPATVDRLASVSVRQETPNIPKSITKREAITLPLSQIATQADFHDRGLWIKGGTEEFEAHIRGGWKNGWSSPRKDNDGTLFHSTTEHHAIMDVHLPWQETLHVRIRARLTRGYTSVTLKLRGEDPVKLSAPAGEGWHILEGTLTRPITNSTLLSMYRPPVWKWIGCISIPNPKAL